MLIRREVEADWPAIDRVNDDAFGGADESALIRRLRQNGDVVLGLVAVDDDRIVGHVLLSRLPTAVDGRQPGVAALAPLAVTPDRQRHGIGSALVLAALAEAAGMGVEAVIVLGHPAYYPRFGFRAASAAHLAAPFSGEAFMALELVPGALAGKAGRVEYPAPFGLDTPRR